MIKAEKRGGKLRFSNLGEERKEKPKSAKPQKSVLKNKMISEGGYLPIKNAKRT